MGYTELAIKRVAAGQTKELICEIVEWSKKGQQVVGKIEDVEPFLASDYDTDCMRYTLDTDDGRVTCVLGAQADNSLKGRDLINHLVTITYGGKVETKKGRTMNDFSVTDHGVCEE